MPQYEFFCHACNRPFSKTLKPTEGKEGYVVCPHCGSDEGEQRWLLHHHDRKERWSRSGSYGAIAEQRSRTRSTWVKTGHFMPTGVLEGQALPPKGSQHGGRYANKEAKRISRWSGH
jgi:putative FmdB family regulatory protein